MAEYRNRPCRSAWSYFSTTRTCTAVPEPPSARTLIRDPKARVDPLRLAEALVARQPDRVLQQVRVYRGRPSNKADPAGYAANRRQVAAWIKSDMTRVYVYTRPLQYLPGERAREKGIDVMLAVDYVVMAVRKQYDVGILMSTDTDLKPALDAVRQLNAGGPPWPEVAAWTGPNAAPRRIDVTDARGTTAPCHWLDEAAFRRVADPTDYGPK